MPSPFPGMDPWLEMPGVWGSVHHSLISLIYTQLNQTLPEEFAAIAAEYVYLVSPRERIGPDVAVVQTPNFAVAPNRAGGTGESLLVATRPVEVSLAALEEITIPFVQVVASRDTERVVAVIEVLSPINKTGNGREQYLKKQRDVLDSSVHLLEIDLLRGGQHTVAVDEDALFQEHRTFWDYLVCLHRAGAGENYTCWPISLREPLPTVALPLTETYPDQLLDLQSILDSCYDAGPFRRTLDYK